MKRFLCLFFALVLSLVPLAACKRQGPDEVPLDPSTIARNSTLSVVSSAAECPNPVFSVRLLDEHDMPVKDATITLTVGEAQFSATTNEQGLAAIETTLAVGAHNAKITFAGNAIYRKSEIDVRLTAEEEQNRAGVYVKAQDFYNVDFAVLQANNIGNVFLHQSVLVNRSKETVEDFIARAAEHDIRVHLWLICLWDQGDFVVPIDTKDGSFLQSYFDTEAQKVRTVAALDGLYGIHFDYIRFEGEETRADDFHANDGHGGELAVTEFVRQMTAVARGINPKLVFSGALMAVEEDLIPRYGQDIKALSSYLDFFVPMLYAGNYSADTAWIAACAQNLSARHPDKEFWAAVLTYESDANLVTKSADALIAEAQVCRENGMRGVVAFLYGKWQNGTDTMSPVPLIPKTDA